ncbi:MAG: bifunctional heptose 7-phosphate kinase/heptose 1-phosphate adenyltransferase [Phycisphaerales bacterium]|nr:bifunctional heptose 7-phosphate kinase/heptose 1-phosphate adenyltransferase [Phycisphaerales bacterium]
MTHTDLIKLVERFAGKRALLVGDFMLDRYVFGDAERISPEAPVPVLRVIERQDRVGGAGSVALNIQSLGGTAVCCGMIGDDAFGRRVSALLAEAGADTTGLLITDDRPTITKTRLVGLAEHRHRQQILRVDDERVGPLIGPDRRKLIEFAQKAIERVDVVCLEDYGKGALAPDVCRAIIDAARAAGKPVLVDPARQAGWEKYTGAMTLTPNRAELEIGAGRSLEDDEIAPAAAELAKALELSAMCVTLGRDGAVLVGPDGGVERFPTRPRAVYDNTGAGDAVLAMMAMAIAAGGSLREATPLANIAGGLEVSKFGCVPIAAAEVLEELRRGGASGVGKIRALPELQSELAARRQRGETVVFTNGCFDVLHAGHIELLEQAKSHGSMLVVGINTDASVREQNKGKDRPIRNQRDRCRLLAALEAVDYVVLFDDPSVAALVAAVSPDVLVKGGDYDKSEVIGADVVESRGGRVVIVPFVSGYSTTGEIERIRIAGAQVR